MMAAAEHLSGQQFFHGSDEDLDVGAEIKPGNVVGHRKFSSEAGGHGEFVWMSPHPSRAAFFGKRVYQVEPQGLTHPYNYGRRGAMHPADEEAHVSLAPVKVMRKGRTRGSGLSVKDYSVRWDDE